MIRVDRVSKNYGSTIAVNDISFEVPEGQNMVLLGTSGCGKTTTLRMINRLTETTAGRITVGGKNIKDIPPETLRRNIGYVLQHNGLFPHYTIAQNIAIVPELLLWPREKIIRRTGELMDQLHLPQEYLNWYPQQLSGGQQQRVGLARALAADPPVLLMDEPFGALDAVTRRGITQEFRQMDVLKNKTIVLVTHDIGEAFDLGDTILLMDKGKIVQAGTPAHLLFHPVNNFVSSFFNDQRMQLEWRTVSLSDIWPFLPGDSGDAPAGTILDGKKNLWEAMAALSANKIKGLLIRNLPSGEQKRADYEGLFNAFTQYKTQWHE